MKTQAAPTNFSSPRPNTLANEPSMLPHGTIKGESMRARKDTKRGDAVGKAEGRSPGNDKENKGIVYYLSSHEKPPSRGEK